MKRLIKCHDKRWILLLSFLMLLTACAKPVMTVAEKQARALICKQQYQHCEQVCVDSCHLCKKNSKVVAMKKYALYLRQQQIQGDFITKLHRSFRDPLQCAKTTCNCMADYNICMQGQMGMVQKRYGVQRSCID